MAPEIAIRHDYIGVLLAAGEGARYRALAHDGSGQDATANGPRERAPADSGAVRGISPPHSHKLLARLPDGRLMAQASAQTLLAVLPDTIAVVAEHPPALSTLLSTLRCGIVTAPNAPRGMGISLATAARHLIERQLTEAAGHRPNGCVVALADMPWVHASTIERLLAHAACDRIVVPVYRGRRGHPVVFGAQFLPELAALDGDTGARALLARHGACEIECDDAGVVRDVDVPADLFTQPQKNH